MYQTDSRHSVKFLRKKLIGKTVKVHIDFIRPKEGEFEERECATVRYGGTQAYVDFTYFVFLLLTFFLGILLSS